MTETERLFLRTIEDVESRIKSSDPYEVLGLSALIRKLFLDDNPLVDQVNRVYRQKIKFIITDPNSPYTQMALSMKPSFYTVQDGLDPETALPSKTRIEVNRDQFFSTMVLMIEGRSYSIREIILFEANIMGAVHAGAPKTDKERAIAEINDIYFGGGNRIAARQLGVFVVNLGKCTLRPICNLISAIRRIMLPKLCLNRPFSDLNTHLMNPFCAT